MSDQRQYPNNNFQQPQAPQQPYGYYPHHYQQQPYPDPSIYPHFKQWFNFREPNYVKGFVVGAGVAVLLTNPAVKKAIVKGVVKLWGGLQSGVEELKEQIRDVQAEVEED